MKPPLVTAMSGSAPCAAPLAASTSAAGSSSLPAWRAAIAGGAAGSNGLGSKVAALPPAAARSADPTSSSPASGPVPVTKSPCITADSSADDRRYVRRTPVQCGEGRTVFAQTDRGMAGREIALQRIDRQAEWLEVTLGPRLAAFAAAMSPAHLARIARREDPAAPDEERRVRNVFAVTSLLATRDGAGSAYTWLTEPNPELDGRSPADLLHDGSAPENVWLAAATPF